MVNVNAVAHIKNNTLLFQSYVINATNQKETQGDQLTMIALHYRTDQI